MQNINVNRKLRFVSALYLSIVLSSETMGSYSYNTAVYIPPVHIPIPNPIYIDRYVDRPVYIPVIDPFTIFLNMAVFGFIWFEFFNNTLEFVSITQKEEMLRESIPTYDQLTEEEKSEKKGTDFLEFVFKHCPDGCKRKELLELFIKEQQNTGSAATVCRLSFLLFFACGCGLLRLNMR